MADKKTSFFNLPPVVAEPLPPKPTPIVEAARPSRGKPALAAPAPFTVTPKE